MHIVADLQLHSRFSRAVSKEMTIPNLSMWAKRKGIGLIATGDWTHPLWFREIEQNLEEVGNGLLRLKQSVVATDNPLFLLATEVSCIYSQGGRGRRVHTLIWVPSLESARKIGQEMTKRGCNLMSDGRPIIGLSSIHVAELVLSIEPKALIIPAHAWTPWFSVFGKMGGFDSLEEAFGPYAKHIYAIETGLSSNPSMNWRIKELDNRSIVSFSDAHSGPKLGREATIFEIPDGNLSYDAIYQAIKGPFVIAQGDENFFDPLLAGSGNPGSHNALQDTNTSDGPSIKLEKRSSKILSPLAPSSNGPHISYTLEFYPEEGKYHYTGHRVCHIRQTPLETKARGMGCPVCGKPLTQGVMERVEELAGRSEESLGMFHDVCTMPDGNAELQMWKSKTFPNRPGFIMLVPLKEIIAECIGSPVASPKVLKPYELLTDNLGGEFPVLLQRSIKEITDIAGGRIAEGVKRVRAGDIYIDPGYDGVFGVVKIWKEREEKPLVDSSKEQLRML